MYKKYFHQTNAHLCKQILRTYVVILVGSFLRNAASMMPSICVFYNLNREDKSSNELLRVSSKRYLICMPCIYRAHEHGGTLVVIVFQGFCANGDPLKSLNHRY